MRARKSRLATLMIRGIKLLARKFAVTKDYTSHFDLYDHSNWLVNGTVNEPVIID